MSHRSQTLSGVCNFDRRTRRDTQYVHPLTLLGLLLLQSFYYWSVCVCVCLCVYVYICVYNCVCIYGNFFFLRQGLLLSLELTLVAKLLTITAPESSCCCFPSTRVPGMNYNLWLPENTSPQACTVSTLHTEPSHWLLSLALILGFCFSA